MKISSNEILIQSTFNDYSPKSLISVNKQVLTLNTSVFQWHFTTKEIGHLSILFVKLREQNQK